MNQFWIRYLPSFFRQKLEGRHTLQNIISNTGWLFADNILRIMVGFLVSVLITRYLGPEQFGLLNYVIAFVALFSSVAMLGLDGIVVRDLVKDPSRRDEILGSAFSLKLIGGVIAAVLALAAITIIRPADYKTLLLVGITSLCLIFQAFGTIDLWFQSQVQSKYVVYARSVSFLIISGVKLVLIYYHAALVSIVWAGVAEIALSSVGLILAFRIHASHLRNWRTTLSIARNLLRDSWPLMLTDIVIFIYMRIDKILLGELAGNVELGIYSVAAMLSEAFYFIPMAVATALYPSILQLKEGPEEVFLDHLQRYYNLMAFLAYAVALPITFFAGWLVPLLFGLSYAKAVPMLIGLAWIGLFKNLTIARGQYLTSLNWNRLHFVIDFLGCLINVSLNFILIPRYGGMGAVIALFISCWFASQGLCFLMRPLNLTGRMLTRAMLYPKIW